MAKTPKPPKGGRRIRNQPPVSSQSTPVPDISAELVAMDSKKYRDQMWKPYKVKSPEGMETVPAFVDQLGLFKMLSNIKVDSAILKKYDALYGGHETYEECMEISHDNMTMILLEALGTAKRYSDMDDPHDSGFIRFLEILVSLYNGNPYTRDRIGWFMWTVARHISPSCYFPLVLDLYYDPRLWHRPGQPQKQPLEIPRSVYFDGSGKVFGPEDDIWSCELPDTGQRERTD